MKTLKMIVFMPLTFPWAVWNMNCSGCFFWAVKNKVCLWKVP